ncbi:MAG: LPS export ABC transporter periplasmic protein LptC [Desulfobacterales bacterium]|nr:LPS export ABC transporter periplasmic protein LptC [Desulfobacterales bacterium]
MKSRVIKILIVIISIAGVIFYLFNKDDKNEKKDVTDISIIESGATVTIKNFKQTARNKGKIIGILKAEKALIFPKKQTVKLIKTELSYFYKDGEKVVIIASEAKINMGTKDIKIFGGVLIKNAVYTFETEELKYVRSKNILFSTGKVIIKSDISRLIAKNMVVNLSENRIEFKGKVKGYFSENL